VPNEQDAQDAGIRDTERERDAFINFSWVRTLNDKLLLTLSPFYHHNHAAFIGGPNDTPVSARDERSSQYGGAQMVLSALTRQHNAKVGFYGFFQRDSAFFRLQGDDGSGNSVNLQQRQNPHGNLAAFFVEDQYKPTSWLTLSGGVRFTRFQGALTENATSRAWARRFEFRVSTCSARFLRTVLSGPTAIDYFRAIAGIRIASRLRLHSFARRAR